MRGREVLGGLRRRELGVRKWRRGRWCNWGRGVCGSGGGSIRGWLSGGTSPTRGGLATHNQHSGQFLAFLSSQHHICTRGKWVLS